jgi:hypothetical protein
MIREWVSHLHWSVMPVISMGLFMAVFFGALIWVFRKESHVVYEELGQLPLDPERK